ncbi:hypothetical protein [Capnocytophaga granulosa]
MVFEDIKKEKIDEMSYNEYTLYSLWNTERMSLYLIKASLG